MMGRALSALAIRELRLAVRIGGSALLGTRAVSALLE